MADLCLDIGNTRIKAGIFNQTGLVDSYIFNQEEVNEILNLIGKSSVRGVIISSTTVIPSALTSYLESKNIPCLKLDHLTPVPVNILYETPLTLGKDRLAGVVGALNHINQESCLIIDSGTCITFDFLDSTRNYLGGNISPGLRMRYQAMHELTANLPLVYTPKNVELTSKNTEKALQSGGLLGMICEIEGIIHRFQQEFGEIKVLFTGGDAKFLAKYIQNEIFVVPNLILEGLHTILQYNINNE